MKLLLVTIAGVMTLLGCSAFAADADEEVNRIYQFFAASKMEKAQPNSGAYLWIPPNTPVIRAVMIGIHNGLPVSILQNHAIREVCRRNGIAQILLTPNGSEIGSVMMKDLNFDVTDAAKTAVYDGYIQRLAELSSHAELITVPIVPLAHSAYMDFPFDVAMRKPDQCLAAIPIKGGVPDKYAFYAAGGRAKQTRPDFSLRNVPVLFVSSSSQETVNWSAYPHGFGQSGALGIYRRDHADHAGDGYEPHNELLGECWEMMSGHFDMLPGDYRFVADWLDVVAHARLPQHPGDALKNLTLRDGWLMDPNVPSTGALPPNHPQPARYLDFKGERRRALWYPTEALARRQFEIVRDEPRREIEMFTFLDPHGSPIDLAHTSMAVMTDTALLPHDGGLFELITHHFTSPPEICTTKHGKDKSGPHKMANVLFPNQSTLPTSSLPLRFDANSGPVELVRSETFTDSRGVRETRFVLRMKRHRLTPDPVFTMFFPRVFHEGDDHFSAAGRTCQIAWVSQDMGHNMQEQIIDFPVIADTSASAPKILLKASSSAGLPVDYFVFKGPGIIREGAFVPLEMPSGRHQPVEVTIAAYQVGHYKTEGGWKPAKSVYRTFQLQP